MHSLGCAKILLFPSRSLKICSNIYIYIYIFVNTSGAFQMPPKQVSLLGAFRGTWETLPEELPKKPGRPKKAAAPEVEKRPVGRPKKVKLEEVKEEVKQEVTELAEPEAKVTPTKPKLEKLSSFETPLRDPEDSPLDFAKKCGQAGGHLGAESGKLGGRPRKDQLVVRGIYSGLSTSNRKPVGALSLQRERDPSVFAQMCVYMAQAEARCEKHEDFEQHIVSIYPKFSLPELQGVESSWC